jgi:hypothetical protein
VEAGTPSKTIPAKSITDEGKQVNPACRKATRANLGGFLPSSSE